MSGATKIYFLSVPIALWWLISEDFGWFLGLLIFVPVSMSIGLVIAAIFKWFLEPLVHWINK